MPVRGGGGEMKLEIEMAHKMVAAIVKDLRNRRGLRQEWESIELEAQQEVRNTWAKLLQNIAAREVRHG